MRAHNRSKSDASLDAQFCRVQRDVLFLYHLHQQVNVQAVHDEENFALKLTLLTERLRGLIYHVAMVDDQRLQRFKTADVLTTSGVTRTRTADEEVALETELAAWPPQQETFTREITTFQETVRLLSHHYFEGQPLLFSQSVRELETSLALAADLRDSYDRILGYRTTGFR